MTYMSLLDGPRDVSPRERAEARFVFHPDMRACTFQALYLGPGFRVVEASIHGVEHVRLKTPQVDTTDVSSLQFYFVSRDPHDLRKRYALVNKKFLAVPWETLSRQARKFIAEQSTPMLVKKADAEHMELRIVCENDVTSVEPLTAIIEVRP